MLVQRVVRVIAAALTLAIVLGTGIAWSNVRSFEDGIFHMFAPSLGKGGDDGAIDILLVGLDSRTTLTATRCRPRSWRRCGPATTNRPTPTRSS
jgi:hypothetical protein